MGKVPKFYRKELHRPVSKINMNVETDASWPFATIPKCLLGDLVIVSRVYGNRSIFLEISAKRCYFRCLAAVSADTSTGTRARTEYGNISTIQASERKFVKLS